MEARPSLTLRAGRVGDAAVLARLQEPGTLADGRPLDYALGLEVGEYRGLKTVGHAGGDAGFHAALLRFPTGRVSVIVLANAGDLDAAVLAERVADVYLEGKLKPEPARPPAADRKEVPVDRGLFDAYAGEYRVAPGLSVTVAREGDRLTVVATGYPKGVLAATSDREFFVRDADAGITFAKPVEGRCPEIVVHFAGQDLPARRVVRPVLTAEQGRAYAGDDHSGELGVVYAVAWRDGRLTVRHPRGVEELRPVSADEFEAPYPISRVTFTRGRGGRVTGFRFDAGAVQHLRFARVDLTPVD